VKAFLILLRRPRYVNSTRRTSRAKKSPVKSGSLA
jgi:hypothetical protein